MEDFSGADAKNRADADLVGALPGTSDGRVGSTVPQETIISVEKGDFVIVSLNNFGTKKELTKYFLGKVLASGVG